MGEAESCYTFEAAMELAIKMEEESFRHYLEAIRIVKNKNARKILRGFALDELEHKHSIERALLEGRMGDEQKMKRSVATMGLDYVLAKKALRPDSDVREVMTYAIHLEKGAVDFYKRMSEGCKGAPMAGIFETLLVDETRHIQAIEDLYEADFLTDN
ncbi:MAG: ferritin family protein [Deltaproteobacteria bacterium]|nr:ferritin family protein [Deltaproteobacteria bacterium]